MNKLPAVLAATALATAALAGCGARTAVAPAAAHPSTATLLSTLGPTGYGEVSIGMSYVDALATGQVTSQAVDGGHVLHLTGHPDAGLCLTRADGVMAIFAGKGMHTPEGLRIGSTAADLVKDYPKVRSIGPDGAVGDAGIFRADAHGGAWYEIDVNRQRVVTTIILRQDHQTCFE
ncbi:MAG TPA: hypothetical protein VJ872_15795 [Nocardioides sp.]|nr:hypothetical protein [Nocardioides sp.]